ncbi:alpha-ribazole phosphatase [Methylotenera sp. N17]|uniref:alpha-ribazole phosphatase n=1 Tax=Methylotenera sp. N17 TaxID=1502761 RepID=UPI000647B4A5|nr:alpha-ribazole phosphatase [Methylotenera sp. N17]
MRLTLIRHTSLQIPAGVCYGQTDVDVAATFMREATHARDKLKHLTFDAVFSSPLQRCVKLAHALVTDNIAHDERLKELHFGDWEMRAWDDIPRDVFDHWAQNYAELAPPNGETFSQLQQRGVAFVEEILQQHPQGHVLVVTHGGMIRAILAHVLNMQLKGLFRFNIDYGSVTQLDFCGTVPKIEYVNR